MRSSIARTVIVPFALAATALVTTAYAAPPAACQNTAPHHTRTLGANTNSVSATSSLAYWDNDCKCYIAQFDIPSTSSPADNYHTKEFSFAGGGSGFPGPQTEAGCKSIHEHYFLYKKNANGNFALVATLHEDGNWTFGTPPFSQPNAPKSHYCTLASSDVSGTFIHLSPPASGSDTYRYLRSSEHDGKFLPVTVTANHDSTPPH